MTHVTRRATKRCVVSFVRLGRDVRRRLADVQVQNTRLDTMSMQGVPKFLVPLASWMARRYQAAVGAKLKKYGLRYDDLYDPLFDLDIDEALKRVPEEEYQLRLQRLKRAMDLSMKHTYLPKEMQEKQTPFLHYLQEPLQQVQAEADEKEQLGTGRHYERSIP